MIVVTGADGFIGSCLTSALNSIGYNDLVLVDRFGSLIKEPNLLNKKFKVKIDRHLFFDWLNHFHNDIECVFHLGARTDTMETDKSIFDQLNLNYSKKLWLHCSQFQIPFIYASSAATYGNGEFGYDDNLDGIHLLKPLNAYGRSKHDFDLWILENETQPPFWAGLKFFNVYGPNEYHKGRMASVVYHAHQQIQQKGTISLFKSYKPEIKHGEQKRDFVYVKDVISVCLHMLKNQHLSGIFNLGTGRAESFNHLAECIAFEHKKKITPEYIEMPEKIKDNYQYFTQANIRKLREFGYTESFYSLKEGIADYFTYLNEHKFL